MASTPGGLPYPLSTDHVVDGATAIQALADTLDALLLRNWPTVVPTFTNLTPGAGAAMVGRVRKVGRTVNYAGSLIYGAATAIGNNPALVLPHQATGAYVAGQILGVFGLSDVSVPAYQAGWARLLTGTTAQIMPGNGTGISGVQPWTWAAGDLITWDLTYESAA